MGRTLGGARRPVASANIFNGTANVWSTLSPAFAVIVGGTSIAGLSSALADTTLSSLVSLALKDDPATVFALGQSGLKTLPSHLSAAAPTPADAATTLTTLVEPVWNRLTVARLPDGKLAAELGANETATGGVASDLSIPLYQQNAGIVSAGRGGDHDYNDLIVQFHFTSGYGQGWLA